MANRSVRATKEEKKIKNLINRTIHLVRGKVAKRAHVGLPDGTFEEEWGRLGFSGPVTHLYHKHPPTGWTKIKGGLKPHAFSPLEMKFKNSDRTIFLFNSDVAMGIMKVDSEWDYFFRNGEADELFFTHAGDGVVYTQLGALEYQKGDYLHLPKGTTYRFVPSTPTTFLTIEGFAGPFEIPERGLVGQHAPFDPAVLVYPEPEAIEDSREWDVRVKRFGEITTFTFPRNPCDVVGYKGDLAPWKLSIDDISPIMSHRQHLPPPAHTTVISAGFVVCSFLPRPLESEPDALKVPFYHSNVDYDEVLFYHDGDFFSRSGIDAGMVTFHPAGFIHGPHPKAIKRTSDKTRTDEAAVMLDSRKPLILTAEAEKTEWKDYWKSWME